MYSYVLTKDVIKKHNSLDISNRGFKYGDGLFETVKILKHKPLLFNQHLDRLQRGACYLQIPIPENLILNIKKHSSNLLSKHHIVSGILRIYIWREATGQYTPNKESCGVIITIKEGSKAFVLNKKGLKVSIYKPNTILENNPLTTFKTIAQLHQVLMAKYCQSKGLDNCIALNNNNRITEGVGANVFFVIKDTIYTPCIASGCLGGVMRREVISFLKQEGLKVISKPLEKNIIHQATEVFFTNSNLGAVWIKSVNETEFQRQDISKKIIQYLNENIPS